MAKRSYKRSNNNRSAKNRRMRGGASATAGPTTWSDGTTTKRFNSKNDFLLEVKKSHWKHHLDQRVTATDNLAYGAHSTFVSSTVDATLVELLNYYVTNTWVLEGEEDPENILGMHEKSGDSNLVSGKRYDLAYPVEMTIGGTAGTAVKGKSKSMGKTKTKTKSMGKTKSKRKSMGKRNV